MLKALVVILSLAACGIAGVTYYRLESLLNPRPRDLQSVFDTPRLVKLSDITHDAFARAKFPDRDLEAVVLPGVENNDRFKLRAVVRWQYGPLNARRLERTCANLLARTYRAMRDHLPATYWKTVLEMEGYRYAPLKKSFSCEVGFDGGLFTVGHVPEYPITTKGVSWPNNPQAKDAALDHCGKPTFDSFVPLGVIEDGKLTTNQWFDMLMQDQENAGEAVRDVVIARLAQAQKEADEHRMHDDHTGHEHLGATLSIPSATMPKKLIGEGLVGESKLDEVLPAK